MEDKERVCTAKGEANNWDKMGACTSLVFQVVYSNSTVMNALEQRVSKSDTVDPQYKHCQDNCTHNFYAIYILFIY